MKKTLITGITGQDGSYLTELLLAKGYEVHGVIRRISFFDIKRINHLYEDPAIYQKRLFLHYGDLTDSNSIRNIIEQVQPDEIYNLGSQSSVQISFGLPKYTVEVNGLGALAILETVRELGLPTRIYQASSSEMYGKVLEIPQSETTPFSPRSPYAIAKVFGFWMVVNFREAYNLFACNGILFNHESPRRDETFVTRKITLAAAKIKLGLQDCLTLGNLEAKRDWGYAPEYVEAIWLMLQQASPDDYVIATGEAHTVREFVEVAFAELGLRLEWEGEKENEIGRDLKTGRVLVKVDPVFYRPTEVDLVVGNAAKAKTKLNWEPRVKFQQLARLMVQADLEQLEKGLSPGWVKASLRG